MPTDALHVAYSEQARTGTISTAEHRACLDSLDVLLTSAGWSSTKRPAQMWLMFSTLPVLRVPPPDTPLEITDLTGDLFNADVRPVNATGKRFLLYDPFVWTIYTPNELVEVGATQADTAANLCAKFITEYGTIYDITYSLEPLRMGPGELSYDLYSSVGSTAWYFTFTRKEPYLGPEYNYDYIGGDSPTSSLYGNISLGGVARGGGYEWTSATSTSNSASIILRAWGELPNPYDIDSTNDPHRVKMIAHLTGDDAVEGRVPLSWPIGIPYSYGMTSAATIKAWACPHQFLWAEASGWNRNYDTDGTARGDYGGILTCPYVFPDKGVTSAALFVRAVNTAYRNLAYGEEIFTGVNGTWRRLASLAHGTGPHPTHMLRAGHGAPVYTRGGEPVLLTPYLALTSAQTPLSGPKIVGQMWDAVGLSDSRYGYRAKEKFDNRTFSLFAKGNPLNNQSDASLWICS